MDSWCININNQQSGKEKAAPVRTPNVSNSIVNASLVVNTAVLTVIAPIVKTTAKMKSNVLKPYPISWIEILMLLEPKLQIIKSNKQIWIRKWVKVAFPWVALEGHKLLQIWPMLNSQIILNGQHNHKRIKVKLNKCCNLINKILFSRFKRKLLTKIPQIWSAKMASRDTPKVAIVKEANAWRNTVSASKLAFLVTRIANVSNAKTTKAPMRENVF